jgi:hypothetical protein
MDKGTHSFLILAHEDEAMIHRLVRRIAPLGPIYVHIDAKTDMSGWACDGLPCAFLTERVPVYWGDWSVVEATTRLIERALEDPSNTRFTLLTGSHYPIISNEEIREKASHAGILIGSRSAPNMPDGSRPESDYQRRFFRSRKPTGPWARIKNGVMNRAVYYQRPLNWKAVAPHSGMRAGEQSWSFDRDFAQYCVTQIRSARPLIDYFAQIVCSDEKVFATLYGEYTNEIGVEGTTYSKWAGGAHPVPLSPEDILGALERYPFWFARKFTSRDLKILDWLDQR